MEDLKNVTMFHAFFLYYMAGIASALKKQVLFGISHKIKNMKTTLIASYVLIAAVLFPGCSQSDAGNRPGAPGAVVAAADKQDGLNKHLLGSVLWYQHSGEMAALYYQAYNLATLRLDQMLAKRKKAPAGSQKSKTAVVVDVDETVLNNSPFETELIKKNITTRRDFDMAWDSWVMSAKAKALPGALEFLQYAKSRGVDVFYVSNRNEGWQKMATRENLANLNFPNSADTATMFFKVREPGKEARRAFIARTHDILLLCGDNLADFRPTSTAGTRMRK